MPDIRTLGFFLAVPLLVAAIAIALWPAAPREPYRFALPQTDATHVEAGEWVGVLATKTRVIERRRAPVEQARNPLQSYELIGVVESDGRQWALIGSSGSTVTLEVGDELVGHELVQILVDRVVFALDGEETVLRLTR